MNAFFFLLALEGDGDLGCSAEQPMVTPSTLWIADLLVGFRTVKGSRHMEIIVQTVAAVVFCSFTPLVQKQR